jgi:thymidylate synthase (FAD)
MKIIEQSFSIESNVDGKAILKNLERVGRTAYKSEDKITDGSDEKLISRIIKLGHEAVIEHESVTVRLIVDRGIQQEVTRHRVASYLIESTRFIKYKDGIKVIKPIELDEHTEAYDDWRTAMQCCETMYKALTDKGVKPQTARTVLPMGLASEVVMTANLREWRHFFKLRTNRAAHPDLRDLATKMLAKFKELIPVIFDDIITE